MSNASSWYWPVPGFSRISSGVGPRWGKTHGGIDIPATRGTPIIASRAGKVIKTGTSCTHNYRKNASCGCGGGYGNYVYIDHKDGYITRYGHMTAVLVRVGDEVEKGQQIGTIGCTGFSTGDHLHFEVRLNGNKLDPEDFVNPENTKAVTDPATVGNIVSSTTLENFIPYNPEYIIGMKSSELTSQPSMAYVNIYLGGKLITDRPNMVQSFEITRYMGVGDTASLVIFDDTWENIEVLFASYWDDVQIEYGYVGSSIKSMMYNMMLQDYSISFTSTGVLMTVQAMSVGAYENLKPISLALNTYNPTEAVRMIAEYMGWDVRPENLVATQDVVSNNPFNLVNENPVTYIKEEIEEVAQTMNTSSETGMGNLVKFHLDSNNVVYFLEETYKSSASSSDVVRTYVYMKGYDSPVIDLSFNIKGVFGGTTSMGVASGVRSSVFDPKTKEEMSHEEDTKTSLTESTGNMQHMRADQSIPLIDSAGYTSNQMKNKLYYTIKHATTSMYEATMTIIGDPSLTLFENIRIINVTDLGYLHHTSGIYMIDGISDSVHNGNMTTTLKLIRNGEINEGVEIINPKELIK